MESLNPSSRGWRCLSDKIPETRAKEPNPELRDRFVPQHRSGQSPRDWCLPRRPADLSVLSRGGSTLNLISPPKEQSWLSDRDFIFSTRYSGPSYILCIKKENQNKVTFVVSPMYSLSMSPHPQLEQITLDPGCELFHVKRKQEVVGLYKSVKKREKDEKIHRRSWSQPAKSRIPAIIGHFLKSVLRLGGTRSSAVPLKVGRHCGSCCQDHFIRRISCPGASFGMRSSAGRSPFLTHWQIWSSLLASEHRHAVTAAAAWWWKARRRSAFQLTGIRLHPHQDDPQHDGEAVDVGLLRGGGVYALQVLRCHVAQGAGTSLPGRLPTVTLPARLLLCEFAPSLRYGQSKVCNLGERWLLWRCTVRDVIRNLRRL